MEKNVGRNDPCPCGSGKKYKNCCMGKEEEAKKTYTTGGKRKFKASVIQSSVDKAQSIFQTAPSGSESKPSSYIFLRYKQTAEDYRMNPASVILPFTIPRSDQTGFKNPEPASRASILSESYEMTTMDYRK